MGPSMLAAAQYKAVLAAAQRINIATKALEIKAPAELDAVLETASTHRPQDC